jgi:negative regulator of sigma-B (phosphoserine phosphatase)
MTAASRASPSPSSLPIAWSVSSKALGGARESGDLHVVVPCAETVLVAAIDGLGHGPEAALAARAAATVLQQHADEPLIPLMQRCHEGLRRTRGVALSLASFGLRDSRMTWIGVGNVEGVLFRVDRFAHPSRDSLLLRGGVVGYQIPELRTAEHPVEAGDVLVFATDGIRWDFSASSPLGLDTQEAADAILARYAKDTDDALVLVVRYLGQPP